MEYKIEWGFQNLMVIAAFRYCLGRRTYIVSSCVDWLLFWWDDLDDVTKNLIVKEIQEALDRDWAGDDCDVDCWKRILEKHYHKGGPPKVIYCKPSKECSEYHKRSQIQINLPEGFIGPS